MGSCDGLTSPEDGGQPSEASPASLIFTAATKSAGAENPHRPQTNLACDLRFSADRYPHAGHLRLVFLWCCRDQQTASPLRFVFQLAAQLERAGIQDGTIQPRLLRHFICCRSTHALDLQAASTRSSLK